MCELFNMAACGGADQVLITSRGDGGGGAARRDTLPANDNDNRQVTTRPPGHQHTSVEFSNTDIDNFKTRSYDTAPSSSFYLHLTLNSKT